MESYLRKKGCTVVGEYALLSEDTYLAICYSNYEHICFVYKVVQHVEGYIIKYSKPLNLTKYIKFGSSENNKSNQSTVIEFGFEFPLKIAFSDKKELEKIVNALKIVTDSTLKYKESLKIEFNNENESLYKAKSQIDDFNSMLNSNSIDLKHCSTIISDLNTQITTLSGSTIKDIFDSQRRIDLLVDKISSSIDELNVIENQLLQYSSHLDSISDLAKSLDQKKEAETSKEANIKQIKDSIQLLINMTDIDFESFEIYINMAINTREQLTQFESGLFKLKSLLIEKDHIFYNISFVKEIAEKLHLYVDKMAHKLSKSIAFHCKQMFNNFNTDMLDSQFYLNLNKSLEIYKGSIDAIHVLKPEAFNLLKDLYIDFISAKFFENMNSVCSNIGLIQDSGIEIKYAESIIVLLNSSLEISNSSMKVLVDIFEIHITNDKLIEYNQILLSKGLKTFFNKINSLMVDLNMKLFIKCALEAFYSQASKSDQNLIFTNTHIHPRLKDLVLSVADLIKETAKGLIESSEDIKISKVEHDHCFEKVAWFIDFVKNLTLLFGKLSISTDESVDEAIQHLFPAILTYISNVANRADDQILRYARSIESSNELFSLTYNQISQLMNMMRGRAKSSYDNYINLFMNKIFDVHFDKLKRFFDNVDKLLSAGLTEDMIKHQANCGKQILSKMIKEYKFKIVKKALTRMHDTVNKLFYQEDNALETVISGKIADFIYSQFNNYNKIINSCYSDGKDKSVKFEFQADDVRKFWTDLYSTNR